MTKRPQGRPEVEVSDETRAEISTLAKYGVAQDTIAAALGMALNTLKKHCGNELMVGRAQGDVILHETQFHRAIRDGDVSMLRWLGIQRLGQVSEKTVNEHTSPDGSMSPKPGLDASRLSTAALSEIVALNDATDAE